MKNSKGLWPAITLFAFSSMAYSAVLIEFKQVDPAKVAQFTGVGCDVGALSGINEGQTTPVALCAVVDVKDGSAVKVTKKNKGLYVCPANSAVLLTDIDEKFIVCGEIDGGLSAANTDELSKRHFRQDSPACPDGQVLTGLSFKNGKYICNTVEK